MPAPERRIFVGDVQGCLGELERLLGAVGFDPSRDDLVPVGDLVNRGPDSLETLRLLREVGARPVLGNHDLHLLRVFRGLRDERPGDTIAGVLTAPDGEELCAWLEGLPFVRSWGDLYAVHAGLHPGWADPEEILRDLDPLRVHPASDFATRVRMCNAAGERPEPGEAGEPGRAGEPGGGFAPWFRFYDPARHGGRGVVFGHWAVLGLVVEPHLRGLDTGCVWGGRLTAWIPEEDRLEDVSAARAYAPIGRA